MGKRKAKDPALVAREQGWARFDERAKVALQLLKMRDAEKTKYSEYYQQKTQLNHFWIVAKKELEDRKTLLRNKIRELQDLEERHQVEIKVLKQRVKHLLFEHQNDATGSKTQGVVSVKLAQEGNRESQAALKQDRRSLERERKELEVAHAAYLRDMQVEHDREMSELRLSMERQARDLQAQYEDLMEETRRRLFKAREADIQRLEQRKAQHIRELLAAHQAAFVDIRGYYQEIMHSNLDRIKSYKEDVAKLTRKEQAYEKKVVAIAQENKKMSAPLAKALEETRRLRAEKEGYERDLLELRDTKARALVLEHDFNTQRWEHEVLRQRYDRLVQERDELHEQFTGALFDVHQKAGFRNLLLEKKLEVAGKEVEKRGAQLQQVLREAQVDEGVEAQVEESLQAVMDAKEATIGELQGELERVIASHNTMVKAYRAKLKKAGVPAQELGFIPVLNGGVHLPGGGMTQKTVQAITLTSPSILQRRTRRTQRLGASTGAAAAAAGAGGGGGMTGTAGFQASVGAGAGLEEDQPDRQRRGDRFDFRLSDLELSTTVGTGTFGRVRVARHKGQDQFYALKILKKSEIIRLKQVDHIKNEVRILSSVSHPFIVNLKGHMQDSKRLYMLLEYVPGGEVFSHLRSEGRFSNDAAKFYAAEITLAFEYLHGFNVVYRDLKPENLLITKGGHLKIADFGFAKVVHDKTFTLCGTPEYLAPELIQQKGHHKGADWWALGILIYEMLRGFPPFYDETPFGIYRKILQGVVEFPRHMDPKARDLIRRLLTADMSRRLGCLKGGASDVRHHPWYGRLNWNAVYDRSIPPPFTPDVRAPNDTRNFDDYPESDHDTAKPLPPKQQELFAAFEEF